MPEGPGRIPAELEENGRDPEMTLEEKKKDLQQRMMEYTRENSCLALSGGVDSAVLAWWAGKCAAQNHTKVYGVTFDTVLHPSADLEAAGQSAGDAGVIHKIITVNELEFANIGQNPPDRCYLCKKGLFQQLLKFGQERGISCFMEGTNQDDLGDYRPGLQAVKELGVKSPLAECGITKEEVRRLAREAGIRAAARPSSPCMATRLPYGAKLDLKLLRRIEAAEEAIKTLGFPVVRVRYHHPIARIEVEKSRLEEAVVRREEILRILKALEFPYATLDLEGFRSGSMDLWEGQREYSEGE